MMSFGAAAFLAFSFIMLIKIFRLVQKSCEMLRLTKLAFGDLRNPNLDDSTKEAAMQGYAKQLIVLFFLLLFGGAAALALPTCLLWLFDWIGVLSFNSVMKAALSWKFLLTSTLLALVFFRFTRKRVSMTFENSYSFLDRALHRLAFVTLPAHIPLSEFEDYVFAKHLAQLEVGKPVFITALPRTGTTLLLELCAGMQEFASHCYRDMPFVPIPLLWSRFSSPFRQYDALRERAHGDSMLVNVDSHEAFEEILWKMFWHEHYKEDRIVPWRDKEHNDFFDFFRNHMRKIIAIRRNDSIPKTRYVSKNNLNIARLDLLRLNFPDALVIVPFRHPLQHAASLLQQHRNFLEIHKRDRFARYYMASIGHYDFGENLRPIDFDDWLASAQSLDPTTLSYWVEYWVAAYGYLLKKTNSHVRFISYEALCEEPGRGLEQIADIIEIHERAPFLEQKSRIRAATPHTMDTEDLPQKIVDTADALYAKLREVSLI